MSNFFRPSRSLFIKPEICSSLSGMNQYIPNTQRGIFQSVSSRVMQFCQDKVSRVFLKPDKKNLSFVSGSQIDPVQFQVNSLLSVTNIQKQTLEQQDHMIIPIPEPRKKLGRVSFKLQKKELEQLKMYYNYINEYILNSQINDQYIKECCAIEQSIETPDIINNRNTQNQLKRTSRPLHDLRLHKKQKLNERRNYINLSAKHKKHLKNQSNKSFRNSKINKKQGVEEIINFGVVKIQEDNFESLSLSEPTSDEYFRESAIPNCRENEQSSLLEDCQLIEQEVHKNRLSLNNSDSQINKPLSEFSSSRIQFIWKGMPSTPQKIPTEQQTPESSKSSQYIVKENSQKGDVEEKTPFFNQNQQMKQIIIEPRNLFSSLNQIEINQKQCIEQKQNFKDQAQENLLFGGQSFCQQGITPCSIFINNLETKEIQKQEKQSGQDQQVQENVNQIKIENKSTSSFLNTEQQDSISSIESTNQFIKSNDIAPKQNNIPFQDIQHLEEQNANKKKQPKYFESPVIENPFMKASPIIYQGQNQGVQTSIFQNIFKNDLPPPQTFPQAKQNFFLQSSQIKVNPFLELPQQPQISFSQLNTQPSQFSSLFSSAPTAPVLMHNDLNQKSLIPQSRNLFYSENSFEQNNQQSMDIDEPNIIESVGQREQNSSSGLFGLMNPFGQQVQNVESFFQDPHQQNLFGPMKQDYLSKKSGSSYQSKKNSKTRITE